MGKIKGAREYDLWKKDVKLTMKGAILAHCYICNGFEESNEDCLGKRSCPLYPYSPHGRKASRALSAVAKRLLD